jgi:hypothetical protein
LHGGDRSRDRQHGHSDQQRQKGPPCGAETPASGSHCRQRWLGAASGVLFAGPVGPARGSFAAEPG